MDLFINKKGITMITLVITIIIMIVLAAVTYKIAVSNDGTINQAKNAARLEKKSEEQERLESEIIAFVSTNIEVTEEIGVDSNGIVGTKTVTNEYGEEVEQLDYYNSFVDFLISQDEGWKVSDLKFKKVIEISSDGITEGKFQLGKTTGSSSSSYRYRIVGPSSSVYRVNEALEITEVEIGGITFKLRK